MSSFARPHLCLCREPFISSLVTDLCPSQTDQSRKVHSKISGPDRVLPLLLLVSTEVLPACCLSVKGNKLPNSVVCRGLFIQAMKLDIPHCQPLGTRLRVLKTKPGHRWKNSASARIIATSKRLLITRPLRDRGLPCRSRGYGSMVCAFHLPSSAA